MNASVMNLNEQSNDSISRRSFRAVLLSLPTGILTAIFAHTLLALGFIAPDISDAQGHDTDVVRRNRCSRAITYGAFASLAALPIGYFLLRDPNARNA